jgi:hypothetical protein
VPRYADIVKEADERGASGEAEERGERSLIGGGERSL